MKKILLPSVRGNCAASYNATVASIVTGLTLALTPPTFAQSTVPATVLPGAGDAMAPMADPRADASLEDIAPLPLTLAAGSSARDDVPADHTGWDRSGDIETENGNPPDKVLEVPQVVDPANASPPDGADPAARDGASPSDDQVGSIDDYQDEEDIGAGAYVYPLPQVGPNTLGINAYRINPGLGVRFGPTYAPATPANVNRALPSSNRMNSAIGSTSPMFPTTQSVSPGPGGGWWTRAR